MSSARGRSGRAVSIAGEGRANRRAAPCAAASTPVRRIEVLEVLWPIEPRSSPRPTVGRPREWLHQVEKLMNRTPDGQAVPHSFGGEQPAPEEPLDLPLAQLNLNAQQPPRLAGAAEPHAERSPTPGIAPPPAPLLRRCRRNGHFSHAKQPSASQHKGKLRSLCCVNNQSTLARRSRKAIEKPEAANHRRVQLTDAWRVALPLTQMQPRRSKLPVRLIPRFQRLRYNCNSARKICLRQHRRQTFEIALILAKSSRPPS